MKHTNVDHQNSFIVSPINIEKIEESESPFGQENRFRMMIYRCVTDPGSNFAKLKNTMDGNIEVYLDEHNLNLLKENVSSLLSGTSKIQGDDLYL